MIITNYFPVQFFPAKELSPCHSTRFLNDTQKKSFDCFPPFPTGKWTVFETYFPHALSGAFCQHSTIHFLKTFQNEVFLG
jgi:hypothetical protein